MHTANTLCPCGSQHLFSSCCEPLLNHSELADTAEALMWSRFCAFKLNNAQQRYLDYLIDTTHPDQQAVIRQRYIYNNDDEAVWTRLEIVDTVQGQPTDSSSVVEFKAYFTTQASLEQEQAHHERSSFLKKQGKWYFVYPNIAFNTVDTTKRNDPCPCGSGKKYKKCCG